MLSFFQRLVVVPFPHKLFICNKCNKPVKGVSATHHQGATKVEYSCHGESGEMLVPDDMKLDFPLEVFL